MRWPEIEALSLRLTLGPLAVFARSAGRWSVVVLDDATAGCGVTVTDDHRERGRALLDAIAFAVEARTMRAGKARTSAVGKRIASAITGALGVFPATKPCPRCGSRKVVRIVFGRVVLGHSCRSCKWERPEAA